MKRYLLLFALLSGQCFGQGVWYSGNITTVAGNVPAGARAPVLTLPNAIVTVCASPAGGSPCSNTVPIYNDQALTSAQANPLTADAQGRFGFWIAPGVYSYSVQDQNGSFIATYPLSLNSPPGPQGPGGIGCGTGNCVVTGSPLSQNITIANNVADASLFAGADIGAKINAAYNSCAGTSSSSPTVSCKVTLPPGGKYSFATMVHIPSYWNAPFITSPVLDCQGSTLTWTGTGDAIQVDYAPSDIPTGKIENCTIVNGAGNTLSTNAIHQFSRQAFTYSYVSVSGFNNAGSAGIFLDNVPINGTPYFDERTIFFRYTSSNNTKGIRLGVDGGTGSFAYTSIYSSECNASDGQICLSVEGVGGGFQSADMYSAFIDMKGNVAATTTAARFISVISGGDIRQSLVHIAAEQQGAAASYLFYVDATSSVNVAGNSFGGGLINFTAGTSDTLVAPELNSPFLLQYPPFALGLQQSRNSKLIWNNNLRYGMVNDGGAAPSGYFQLFGRLTTNPSDPEVDATPSTGNKQYNLEYCDSFANGCGFGPGYGASATTGGTTTPIYSLESTQLAVRNPSLATVADGGAQMNRYVDSSGNIVDYVRSGTAGQPSNHYIQKFDDYVSSSIVSGMDCHASGTVFCTIPGLTLAAQILSCGGSGDAGKLNYVPGATGVKDTVQVCAKDATNAYAWRTIY